MPALDLDPPVPPVRQAAGAQFHVVLHEGPGGDEALRGLLAQAGPDAQVIRVGNPLRAPLTIERILIQTGLVEAGLLTDAEADQAMQQLLRQKDGRTVLVIEQAETLSQPALQALARLASPAPAFADRPAGRAASLHIVFAGEPAFYGLVLATSGVSPIRAALPHLPGPPPAAEPSADALPSADAPPWVGALPPVAPQSSPPSPMPGIRPETLPETASWFQVVSAGAEAAPPADQALAPVPSPARLRAGQVFWILLLFFLAGLGTVLGVAVLFQR